MSKRNDAIEAGKITYSSGKPCGKGHASDRYSSNGMCVECLRTQAEQRKGAAKRARVARNSALFSGLQPTTVYVRENQKEAVYAFADILRYGSAEAIAQCEAFHQMLLSGIL